MRRRTARRMTRRGLLAAMLAGVVALPGCKKKGESQSPSREIEVTLVVRADKNCNEGRPLQVVVRKVSRKSFVEDDYAWVTERIVDVAHRHGEGRIVSLLEGGYNLGALSRSVAAHLRELIAA